MSVALFVRSEARTLRGAKYRSRSGGISSTRITEYRRLLRSLSRNARERERRAMLRDFCEPTIRYKTRARKGCIIVNILHAYK